MDVAAHSHGAEGMKRAVQAGVRSIEHGTFMDDEVIALIKADFLAGDGRYLGSVSSPKLQNEVR